MKRGAQCREEVIDPNSFRAPTGNSGGGDSTGGNRAKTIRRRKPTAEIQSAAAAAVFYTVANVKNLAGIRAGEAIGWRDKCPAPIGPADDGLTWVRMRVRAGAHPDLPVRMKSGELFKLFFFRWMNSAPARTEGLLVAGEAGTQKRPSGNWFMAVHLS